MPVKQSRDVDLVVATVTFFQRDRTKAAQAQTQRENKVTKFRTMAAQIQPMSPNPGTNDIQNRFKVMILHDKISTALAKHSYVCECKPRCEHAVYVHRSRAGGCGFGKP